MSFNAGGGGGISTATDVALSNPATGNFLTYTTVTAKWSNATLAGNAALATGGGQETVFTDTTTTGATTLNLASGNVFAMTLTGNATFTFSGAVTGKACSLSLYLTQDATGSRTVTWPSGIKWSGGIPVISTIASRTDILVFETLNGGTTWYGSLVGVNFV